jgi:hypothetical protein
MGIQLQSTLWRVSHWEVHVNVRMQKRNVYPRLAQVIGNGFSLYPQLWWSHKVSSRETEMVLCSQILCFWGGYGISPDLPLTSCWFLGLIYSTHVPKPNFLVWKPLSLISDSPWEFQDPTPLKSWVSGLILRWPRTLSRFSEIFGMVLITEQIQQTKRATELDNQGPYWKYMCYLLRIFISIFFPLIYKHNSTTHVCICVQSIYTLKILQNKLQNHISNSPPPLFHLTLGY